jgi:hypothetical protein
MLIDTARKLTPE